MAFLVAGAGELWKDARVRFRDFLCALMIATLGAGCVGPVKGLFPPAAGEPSHAIYVVSHGWHTGLVLPRAELRAGALPEVEDFPTAEFLEIGWGEDGFYRAEKATVGLAAKALLWRNKSVLHVVGFRGPVNEYFYASKVVKVEVSTLGLEMLCAFIHDEHQYDAAAKTLRLGPGLYGESQFYRASGSYYFPKTCNVWTARALRRAGCPITSAYAIPASNVMFQARRFGREVKPPTEQPHPHFEK